MSTEDTTEEWRTVVGYPDYAVSSMGRVKRATPYRSTKPGRLVRPGVHKDGHLYVRLFICGRMKTSQLHRVVAFAFLGEPPTDKHVVAHNNGCPSDNRARNLRWATHIENFHDRQAHGTWPAGERNGNHKLTDVQVQLIRARVLIGGERKAEVARLFQVSDTHVHKIVSGAMRVSAGGYLAEVNSR